MTSLLLAFGPSLPFFRALEAVAPLRRLRYPIKFYLLTTLCVALLAGFGAERLAARRIGKREAAALALAALLYGAAFAAARDGGLLERSVRPLLAGLAAPAEALLPAIRRSFGVDALLGLAAVAAVAAILLFRSRSPAPGYLLGFAALLFALPWGLPLFVTAGEKDLERPPALAPAISGGGRLYVSPRLPEFNVLATGTAHREMAPRVSKLARVQIEELIPGTGEPFGVRYLFDADPDGSYGYYNRLAAEALSASSPEERSRLLRAFGSRWILAEENERYPTARFVTGVTVAGRRLVLLELPEPAAELRWAGLERRRRALSGALALLRSDRFEPQVDVVLPGSSDGDAAQAARARLKVESVEPDAAAARVEAEGAGYVLFSRTYFPAWMARVDGREARVLVANARELAVAVPPGVHRVEFGWDRAPFHRGVALQSAALLLLALAGWSARRI